MKLTPLTIEQLITAPIAGEYLVQWRNTHTGKSGEWRGSRADIVEAADKERVSENFEWVSARELYFPNHEKDDYGDLVLSTKSEELADAVLALNRDGMIYEVAAFYS